MAIDWGAEFGGNSPQQPQGSVGNAVVASGSAQSAAIDPLQQAIDRLQHAKDVTKRYIDQMGQTTTETPGGIFGRKWSYGDKVYTDQQLADAKSAVDRAQNDDEIYQAIRNLANANDQSEVGTGWGGELARGMNNTPIASIGNNSLLGNNRTKYEYPEDDSSWAYTIGKYGGGGLELASDLAGAGDVLKMAKAARFNPFNFAGQLYRDAKQTGKDIVNLPGNIVKGIRNAGSKTSNFVKDSVKAGTEGKSLKAYNAERAAPAGETAQTGGRAAETAAPAAERTAASETAAPAAERTAASETAAPAPRQEPAPAPRQEPAPAPRQEPAPAPRQEPAPQQPAPAPRQEPAPQQPAPAPRQEPAPERTAPAEGSPELRSNSDGTPDLAGTINGEGTGAAGGAPKTGAGEAAGSAPKTGAGEAAADGGVSELANAGNAGRSSVDEAMEAAENFDELIRSIESGTVDEMGKAWIESLANQEAAGFGNEAINGVLAAARATGIIK